MVRIGLLGCGFLATFYMQGLAEVPKRCRESLIAER